MRVLLIAILVAAFAPEPARAIPSLSLLWKTGTPADRSVLVANPGDEAVADIVLTGVFESAITGVFITIEFDNGELEALSGFEIPTVNLPGMGNSFSPIAAGVTVNNVSGVIENFDQATVDAGFQSLQSRTLGSVTFRVVNPSVAAGEQDVRITLSNVGIDAIVINQATLEASTPGLVSAFAFESAEVVSGAMPEPTTSLLILGGLVMLGYAGRRRA